MLALSNKDWSFKIQYHILYDSSKRFIKWNIFEETSTLTSRASIVKKISIFISNVSFPLYYYTPLIFNLFLFNNVKKGEKRWLFFIVFYCFLGYQKHHSIYCKRYGEICKIGEDIQDMRRFQASSKNFSSTCFVIIKRRGIVKKTCSCFLTWF